MTKVDSHPSEVSIWIRSPPHATFLSYSNSDYSFLRTRLESTCYGSFLLRFYPQFSPMPTAACPLPTNDLQIKFHAELQVPTNHQKSFNYAWTWRNHARVVRARCSHVTGITGEGMSGSSGLLCDTTNSPTERTEPTGQPNQPNQASFAPLSSRSRRLLKFL